MKKVLVLEDISAQPKSGFDHVFSFRSQTADSYPDELIDPNEIEGVYDAAYDKLCSLLNCEELSKHFTFQGVNLLWCFKKELFYTAYQVSTRYAIFRKLAEKNPESKFYVDSANGPNRELGLHRILKESPYADRSETFASSLKKGEEKNFDYTGPSEGKRLPLPEVIRIGGLRHCEIIIFSSFSRCQSVIKHLKKGHCLLYSNVVAPRNISRSVWHGLSLYQASLSAKSKRYQNEVRAFCEKLRSVSPFVTFDVEGLNAGKFLQERMEMLWRRYLPQVLFEIENLHQLFQQGKGIKSALLDEDVDPSKNAFCQVSRQYGIESFVELHGAMGGRHGLVPLTADKIFVWGEAQKKRLIQWGVSAVRIIVSGCSRYARYQQLNSSDLRTGLVKRYGLDPKRKIGILAFMPLIRWHLTFETRIHKLIHETLQTALVTARERNLHFLIKLHPADFNNPTYERWIKANNAADRFLVIREADPLELGRAVDFLIVHGSTYAIDGFALNKPVIVLDPDYPKGLLDEFVPFGVFDFSKNQDELKKQIERVAAGEVNSSSRRHEALRQCLNQDGTAPEKFIAETLTHVQKNRNS